MTTMDDAAVEELKRRFEELERRLQDGTNSAVPSGRVVEDKIRKKLEQIKGERRRAVMGGSEDEEYYIFGEKWIVYAGRKNLLPHSIAENIEELRRIKQRAESFEENATLDAAIRRGPRSKEEVLG